MELDKHRHCSVCFQELANNLAFSITCGHVYHNACIEQHMLQYTTCPLCDVVIGGKQKLYLTIHEKEVQSTPICKPGDVLRTLKTALGKRTEMLRRFIEIKEERKDWLNVMEECLDTDSIVVGDISERVSHIKTKLVQLKDYFNFIESELEETALKYRHLKRKAPGQFSQQSPLTTPSKSKQPIPTYIDELKRISRLQRYKRLIKNLMLLYTNMAKALLTLKPINCEILLMKQRCRESILEDRKITKEEIESEIQSIGKTICRITPRKILKGSLATVHDEII